MNSKNLIEDHTYRKALENSWNVPINENEIFPENILCWLVKKSNELGVPVSYLTYPLMTSIAYCLGGSSVRVTETYTEPVILYCLVSGRSGTNKSGSLSLMKDMLCSVNMATEHVFDTGTMEGLMGTMKSNGGSVLCAVDEFAIFLDAMDKNSNGNAEKCRYLSLWSGIEWSKKTKHGGLDLIKNPRFQFIAYNQNYFLMNLIKNLNHYDGFLPRFLVATPKEVYIPLREKINAAKENDDINMGKIMKNVFEHFHRNGGVSFELSSDAMNDFANYHDNDVLEFRKEEKFNDLKSMILSKSIGNVLRVSAVQCALRLGLNSLANDNAFENILIEREDIVRAIVLVKYSVNVLLSIIDDTRGSSPVPVMKRKRNEYMPEPHVMDEEFLHMHRAKIQKIFNQDTKVIPFSQISRNHLYPQIGGKQDRVCAIKFLKGLEKNGLGMFYEGESDYGKKATFVIIDKENTSPEKMELLKSLGIQ